MSAPLIWIGFPLIIAVISWFLQAHRTLVLILVSICCLLLVFLAGFLPIETIMRIGSWSFEISATLVMLGRRFVLDSRDCSLLILVYTFGGLYFLVACIINVHRFFAPLGLAIMALLVASLAVEPFLYSALLIEIAVLLSIPLLVPPGYTVGQGVLRYIIYQTLAIPFILFAGWASGGGEVTLVDERLILQVAVFLGLGFAFWLAVFPFYTWVPLLVKETNPYVAGFVLNLLPTVVLLLILDCLNAFTWLWENPHFLYTIQIIGTLMVATGGIWAVFEINLARLFGHAVIIGNGYSLLALSMGNETGLEIYVILFLPRIFALSVWALSMAILGEECILDFEGVRGLLRRYPFACLALLMACFSLGGLPLLAGFPVRQMLLGSLAESSLLLTLWVFIGSLGLIISGFRLFASIVDCEKQSWQINESWSHSLALIVGMTFLIFMGMFPSWFLPGLLNLLEAFRRIL